MSNSPLEELAENVNPDAIWEYAVGGNPLNRKQVGILVEGLREERRKFEVAQEEKERAQDLTPEEKRERRNAKARARRAAKKRREERK